MEIQIFPIHTSGEKRIGIKPMHYDKAFPQLMKKITGKRWTSDVKC